LTAKVRWATFGMGLFWNEISLVSKSMTAPARFRSRRLDRDGPGVQEEFPTGIGHQAPIHLPKRLHHAHRGVGHGLVDLLVKELKTRRRVHPTLLLKEILNRIDPLHQLLGKGSSLAGDITCVVG
jgi:hypothetical protein